MSEVRIIRRSAGKAVKKSDALEAGRRFSKTMEVVGSRSRGVADIVNEWPLENRSGTVIAETLGNGLQYSQVRRAFEIQHPTGLFGLVVLFESNLSESLAHLALTASNPMRTAHERDHQVPACGFVQEHLRMAIRDDLVSLLGSHLRYQVVDLTLAKNLEMGVGFVQ